MGKPAASGVAATGAPSAGDQANAVVSGSFVAAGPSNPFAIWGALNVCIWGSVNTALTPAVGGLTGSVVSATGLIQGQNINSSLVPAGTTIGSIIGTTITFAFPPNTSAANVVQGTDAAALFVGAVWAGSVQLERSFDGGATWLVCGVGGGGVGAIYAGADLAGQPVSIVASEPERQVLYRLNCTTYTSGTINYRISTTGLAALPWGIQV